MFSSPVLTSDKTVGVVFSLENQPPLTCRSEIPSRFLKSSCHDYSSDWRLHALNAHLEHFLNWKPDSRVAEVDALS